MKTTLNIASILSVWLYVVMLIFISCQQQCFHFEPLNTIIGVVSSLLFLLLSLGLAIAAKRKAQRYQPLDLFFVALMALPVCFWLFFYLRDIVGA